MGSSPAAVYISIHALREEGDPPGKCKKAPIPRFQSTPSARRATQTRAGHTWGRTDFNPRPPRGERLWSSLSATMISSNFNPRPPRGGRQLCLLIVSLLSLFQSTPSARRATRSSAASGPPRRNFNPRPPRGGRPGAAVTVLVRCRFQSTPSARRATQAPSHLL